MFEGDKASMEVPAPEAGVVKEVLVKVGDKSQLAHRMLVLESADSAALLQRQQHLHRQPHQQLQV